MAVSFKHYARALYEASFDKSKAEVAKITDRFFEMLKEKGLSRRAADIIAEVEKIDDEAHGRIRASVISAHRLDEGSVEKLEKLIRHRTGAKEVVWEKEVDKSVLGGVVLRFGDTVLDMSLKQSVASLTEDIRR